MNRFKLFIQMIIKFGLFFATIGVTLFVCAGTADYINGWIFTVALAAPMAIFGFSMLIKDPATLERRLVAKEPDKKQGMVILASAVMFILVFTISGFDYRFGWSGMDFGIVIAAVAVMLLGYAMFTAVILQNSYAARVVDTYDNQKVITTGLYAVVRHPMYLALLFVFFSMPFILGSWYAVIPMLIFPVILVFRIKNEEELLLKELEGYREYTNKVRYRLLPFIW